MMNEPEVLAAMKDPEIMPILLDGKVFAFLVKGLATESHSSLLVSYLFKYVCNATCSDEKPCKHWEVLLESKSELTTN